MEIKRLMTNICTTDLEQSKNFYTSLFDLNIAYDSDWFVQLVSKGAGIEIGLIAADHDVVPEQTKGTVSGLYLTFVIEDVDAFYDEFVSLGYEVLQVPELTTYGQKRMLCRAPEGTVCDVSSPA